MRCFKLLCFVHLIYHVSSNTGPLPKTSSADISKNVQHGQLRIRKCCLEGEALYLSNKTTCRKSNFSSPFVFYNNITAVNISKSDYYLVYENKCPDNMARIPEPKFYLQTNGSLLVRGGNGYPDEFYPPENYCVDTASQNPITLLCVKESLELTTHILVTGTYAHLFLGFIWFSSLRRLESDPQTLLKLFHYIKNYFLPKTTPLLPKNCHMLNNMLNKEPRTWF